MQERITPLLLHHSLVDSWRFGGFVFEDFEANKIKNSMPKWGKGLCGYPSPPFFLFYKNRIGMKQRKTEKRISRETDI